MKKISDLKQLWAQYLDNQDRTAREALLTHYIYLVKYAVGRMMLKLPSHIDGDDLIGYGLIGLIQSLEKFDAERAVKFETFAMTRIRGAILDALRAQDWMPRSLRKKAKVIEKAIRSIEARTGQAAQEEDIAKELDLPLDTLREQLLETSFLVVSLDYLLHPDSPYSVGNALASTDDTTQELDQEAVRDALTQALGGLPERERNLISFYYFEGLTMKEIGVVLKVSEARVCQIHAQSIHRLKARMLNLLGET